MRTPEWVLINVVAENNRHLNDMPLFIHGLACFTLDFTTWRYVIGEKP